MPPSSTSGSTQPTHFDTGGIGKQASSRNGSSATTSSHLSKATSPTSFQFGTASSGGSSPAISASSNPASGSGSNTLSSLNVGSFSPIGRESAESTGIDLNPTGGSGSAISRPASAASVRVRVDKPSVEAAENASLFTHPPTGYEIIWALSVRILAAIPRYLTGQNKYKPRGWDDPHRWKKEALVKDVRYYARSAGFEIVNETVETADGYYLRVHRVVDPTRAHERHSDGRGGFPVLIMHGLFQSSGSFVTSEERSLAFWLARQGGYQVFLGNNRGVFDMGHKSFSRSDPRFWDYNIRELAIYDLPALVDFVCKETGYEKIGFIGHSQGNGTAFISLSRGMVPELGERLTYFGALAPAVYAGPLTSCFPFTTLRNLEWKTWKRFFGVLDFIPLMKQSYDWTPAYPYALLGYQMFAFLFAWTDANWLERRKPKMFRFTPQPVSSASIYWWAGKGGFASRGCTLDPTSGKWYDKRFPPLAIYSGGMDFLVLTDPLLERLETVEKDVKLIRAKRQEEAEHCDHFWACDAVEWCFWDILEDLESTRPMYPEEKEAGRKFPAKPDEAVDPDERAISKGQNPQEARLVDTD
ncbi:lipid particle protein [Ceraceosorus bombacis]|uniref:sterol esterase n=1 Tax=Ceraceosorus bombacis TaxID=401625 RepID=A0A0N7LA30_9BASI|nr:lipid particle protein [Ceraceosorus bombacis]